jgi:hypothetical protein
MELSGQLHAPVALYPGKVSGRSGKEKISKATAENLTTILSL